MDRIIEYTLSEAYRDRKLYEFLRENGYSRQNITDLKYTDSGVFVGGERIKMDYRLVPGQTIAVHIRENRNSPKIPPVELPFDVVYEDEDVVVVNKPAGMPIHPSLNNYENTLGNAAAFYYNSQGLEFVFRCINRLDRDTTGLTIIAKNMVSANMLSKDHKLGNISKEYIAIVSGEMTESEGTIDLPIGRCNDSSIKRCVDHIGGDSAITHFKVEKKGNGLSVVRLWLETGRTHQIRVHMSAMGYPLIGDFLYNSQNTHMSRQALHVEKMSFVSPIMGNKVVLNAPIPTDMKEVMDCI